MESNPQSHGLGPPQMNLHALARISTTHHYASLRSSRSAHSTHERTNTRREDEHEDSRRGEKTNTRIHDELEERQ